MSSEATMDDFVSKPKIYRLPAFIADNQTFDNSQQVNHKKNKQFLLPLLLLPFIALLFVAYLYISSYSDDQRLMELINSTDQVVKPNNASLYFKDEEGSIVGQMVKITNDNKPASSPNTPAEDNPEIDPNAQKDLLNILGKH